MLDVRTLKPFWIYVLLARRISSLQLEHGYGRHTAALLLTFHDNAPVGSYRRYCLRNYLLCPCRTTMLASQRTSVVCKIYQALFGQHLRVEQYLRVYRISECLDSGQHRDV